MAVWSDFGIDAAVAATKGMEVSALLSLPDR